MILRDYQTKLIQELYIELASGITEVVIASCPSSGKTFMMTEFIKQQANCTFLILTHGQNILKQMWGRALDTAGIEASTEQGRSRVTYGLPQSLHRRDLKPVDFLIIDEAHHFSQAEMVKSLKTKLKPKYIIYLTGTPSKFIAAGTKCLVIPALDLIPEYVSDLYVGLVSTTAPILDTDRNREGDVLPSGQEKLEKSVTEDLDSLLDGIYRRLRETDFYKSNPEMRQNNTWPSTIGYLHKTMIACASVKQAALVESYFQDQQIPVLSSNSKDDVDSLNITRFMEDDGIRILVVVDRGVLGFNMEHLVNVVDLTGSRNIDSIYQLYARVMRKHPKYQKKYFFKLAEEGQLDMAKFYMNAALCMMSEDFITRYNGKNLNGQQIMCLKPVKTEEKKLRSKYKPSTLEISPSPRVVPIDKFFYSEVMATGLLKTILSKMGDLASEYAYITIGEVKKINYGQRIHDPDGTKQDILDFIIQYKKRPSKSKSSTMYENRLAERLSAYLSSRRLDIQFKNLVESLLEDFRIKYSPIADTSVPILNLDQILPPCRVRYIKYYKECMEMKPNNVEWVGGQIWPGKDGIIHMLDNEYGPFKTTPRSLISSWKKGLTGHMRRGYDIASDKKRGKYYPPRNKTKVSDNNTDKHYIQQEGA